MTKKSDSHISEQVLDFWFEEISPSKWFKIDVRLDEDIRERFLPVLEAAKRGECVSWRSTLEGRLAEIIVLDQFSRNIFRNDPRSFSQDSMALTLAQEAIRWFDPFELPPEKRSFLYMPFMHSESLLIHEQAMELFAQEGLESSFVYEKKHREILLEFGRYPHRNDTLGREATEAEKIFLKQPGSSF